MLFFNFPGLAVAIVSWALGLFLLTRLLPTLDVPYVLASSSFLAALLSLWYDDSDRPKFWAAYRQHLDDFFLSIGPRHVPSSDYRPNPDRRAAVCGFPLAFSPFLFQFVLLLFSIFDALKGFGAARPLQYLLYNAFSAICCALTILVFNILYKRRQHLLSSGTDSILPR